jgi:hypothetical protein
MLAKDQINSGSPKRVRRPELPGKEDREGELADNSRQSRVETHSETIRRDEFIWGS